MRVKLWLSPSAQSMVAEKMTRCGIPKPQQSPVFTRWQEDLEFDLSQDTGEKLIRIGDCHQYTLVDRATGRGLGVIFELEWDRDTGKLHVLAFRLIDSNPNLSKNKTS